MSTDIYEMSKKSILLDKSALQIIKDETLFYVLAKRVWEEICRTVSTECQSCINPENMTVMQHTCLDLWIESRLIGLEKVQFFCVKYFDFIFQSIDWNCINAELAKLEIDTSTFGSRWSTRKKIAVLKTEVMTLIPSVSVGEGYQLLIRRITSRLNSNKSSKQ